MQPELQPEIEKGPIASEFDLWSYVDAIWRRRWLVIVAMAIAAFYSAYDLAKQVPVFTSTARILIQPPATNVTDLTQLLQSRGRNNVEIETQLQLLDSRAFAEYVVQQEHLLGDHDSNPDSPADASAAATAVPANPKTAEPSTFQRLRWRIRGAWQSAEGGLRSAFEWAVGVREVKGLDESVLPAKLRDQRLTGAINRVRGHTSVRPVEGTHLVDISWRDVDPVLATKMANAVAQAFVAYNLETQNRLSEQATDFLDSEIQRLRGEIRDDESRLGDMGDELGIDEEGASGAQGSAALGSQLAAARSRRISLETEYGALQDMSASASPDVGNAPAVRRLRDELGRLQSQREELGRRLTEEHPQMKDLAARISETETELRVEEQDAYRNVLAQKRQELQAARAAEQRLLGLVTGQQGLREDQYDDLVEYRALRMNVENKRSLLEEFTNRRSKLDLSSRVQGFEGASIQIVDSAVLPFNPSNKQWMQTILMAMLLGGTVGAVLALGIDYLDNTLREPDDVERRLGVTTLGTVSTIGATRNLKDKGEYVEALEGDVDPELVAAQSPRSRMAEEYRELRTALLLSTGGGPPRSLVITSATPGEGKTTSSVNLALSMADAGKRVLLVDGDLRRPRLAGILGLGKVDGFSNYLAGNAEWTGVLHKTQNENLLVLPSGPVPPNPAELFGTDLPRAFLEEAQQHFDIIIIDTPPALTVVDALILAPLVDGVAIVARANQTAHQLVAKAIARIEDVQGRVLGVVLNGIDLQRQFGYGRYSRYYSQYGYGYRYSSSSRPE